MTQGLNLKLVSPMTHALAGGLFITMPPGKPRSRWEETINKTKRLLSAWEKIFANEATEKRLIFKTYKRLMQFNGLPWWFSGKESACRCRRCKFNPWIRKIPWRRKWQPTIAFLPGKSHEQRNLAGYSLWHNLATQQQQKMQLSIKTNNPI